MKMYIAKPSPYVRRALITAHEKNVFGRIEFISINPWEDPAALHAENPIGRLPTLVLDSGQPMAESLVIMQYFDDIGDGPALGGMEALRRTGIHQGIIDSTYALVIEGRRPDERKWDELIQRQTRVIERTVKAATPSDGFDFGDITLVTALGYLNFRLPELDWQSIRPDLVEWMESLSSRPSVKLTAPDAP